MTRHPPRRIGDFKECKQCGKFFAVEHGKGKGNIQYCPKHRGVAKSVARHMRSLGLRDTPIGEMECIKCGNTFQPKSKWNGFRMIFEKGQMVRKLCYNCSALLGKKWKQPVPKSEIICHVCEKPFMGHPKIQKYCSVECRKVAQNFQLSLSHKKKFEEKFGVCDAECHDFLERVKSIPDIPNTREQISEEEEKRILDKAKDNFDMSNFVTIQADLRWMDENGLPTQEFKKQFGAEFWKISKIYDRPKWKGGNRVIPHRWSIFILYRVEQNAHVVRYEYVTQLKKSYRHTYDRRTDLTKPQRRKVARYNSRSEATWALTKFLREQDGSSARIGFFQEYLFAHPEIYGWKGDARTYNGKVRNWEK